MNPTSLSRSSTAPTWIGTSGITSFIRAIPSGDAISDKQLQSRDTGALEDLAGPHRRAARRQHRVDQEGDRHPGSGRELVVILGRSSASLHPDTTRYARPRPPGSGRALRRPFPVPPVRSGQSLRHRPSVRVDVRPSGVFTSPAIVFKSAVASWASKIASERTNWRKTGGGVRTSRSSASLCCTMGWEEITTDGTGRSSSSPSRWTDQVRLRRSYTTGGRGAAGFPIFRQGMIGRPPGLVLIKTAPPPYTELITVPARCPEFLVPSGRE